MIDSIHKYHLTIPTPDRRKNVDPQDINYICVYLWFDHRIKVNSGVYEVGKYGGSHFHAIALTKNRISFKAMSHMASYRLFWKKVLHEQQLKNIKK